MRSRRRKARISEAINQWDTVQSIRFKKDPRDVQLFQMFHCQHAVPTSTSDQLYQERQPMGEKKSSPESNCSVLPFAGLWPFSGERCWVSCMVAMKDALVSMVQRRRPCLPNSSCSRAHLKDKLKKKKRKRLSNLFYLHQLTPSAFPNGFQVTPCWL